MFQAFISGTASLTTHESSNMPSTTIATGLVAQKGNYKNALAIHKAGLESSVIFWSLKSHDAECNFVEGFYPSLTIIW